MPLWVNLSITAFAAVGVGVVTFILCLIVGEFVRAARQAYRFSVVCIRLRLRRRSGVEKVGNARSFRPERL